MKARLAAKAADVATETVCVGSSWVKRQPTRLGVERVFLVYVVVLFFPGSELNIQAKTQKYREETEGGHLAEVHVGQYAMGLKGSLGADLLPINVHSRKITHSMAECAQAVRRENKER